MKSITFPGIAALGCLILASCYPYPEDQAQQKPNQAPDKTVSSQDQQEIQEQRDRMKAEAERKKQEAEATAGQPTSPGGTQPTTPTPPVEPKKTDYAFANPVPGKEGFVFSPYNNKMVDVRDIPSGTLVQDPTYPASEKKYFRVP
jgi:hypothetical protein